MSSLPGAKQFYEYYQLIDPIKAGKIARLSSVAWQHINFIGKYEFYNQGNPINIQGIIELLLENSEIDISATSQ